MLTRFAAVSLMAAGIANAQPVCNVGSVRSVGANGTAALKLRPDRVSFSVGVETTSSTVAQAMAGNSAKVSALLAALKGKGVRPEEIQTSEIEVDSVRDENGKRIGGFQVSNRVSITRNDPAEAGALLQTAVNSGANQAGGFRLFVADPSKHRDRGLELAFEDARVKAAKLAALAGGTLGAVLCVAEGGYSTSGVGAVTETIMVSAQAAPIEAGVEEVSYSIYVVFELK